MMVRREHSDCVFFFSSRRRHTRFDCDWSSDVCSSDLGAGGKVLETGAPFVTEDYVNDAQISKGYVETAIAEGVVTQAVVPLRSRGAIIGLLCVANRSPRRFTPVEVRALERLADQAAIAMENSRLYALLSQQTPRLRALREIDQGILAARSARGIAETALSRLAG